MSRGLRFSAGIFIAVVITWMGLGTTAASPDDSAVACAVCHARTVQEWSVSGHAVAGQSDAFLALGDMASEKAPDWPTEDCLRCHAPLDESNDSDFPGVSCGVCHGITSVDGIGNGAFRMATDGILRAVTARQSPHPTVALDVLTESRFCAACHEQIHPVTGVPLQTTYSEWLNSPAASAGQSCQDCHMRQGGEVSHAMGPSASDAAAKADALAQAIALDAKSPETATAGRQVLLEVILQNHGAGHALPTGKNEEGEIWLEVTASKADGAVLYQESLSYGLVYDDAQGNHDAPLTLWDAARLFTDRRLQPGRALREQFAFAVPVDVQGDLRVDVALMYRCVPKWLAESLSLPLASALPVRRVLLVLPVLEPPPPPAYVQPTLLPTALPLPTISSGTTLEGVKGEDRGWIEPVAVVGILLLVGVVFVALRRRAV